MLRSESSSRLWIDRYIGQSDGPGPSLLGKSMNIVRDRK